MVLQNHIVRLQKLDEPRVAEQIVFTAFAVHLDDIGMRDVAGSQIRYRLHQCDITNRYVPVRKTDRMGRDPVFQAVQTNIVLQIPMKHGIGLER